MSEPVFAHGKICYIQMPSRNVQESADFFRTVFGWNVRNRGDGKVAFDDATGYVSGMWDPARAAVDDPGMIISIMVDDAVATSAAIEAAGGKIVDAVEPAAREVHGTFRDPSGNLLSIYQHRG